MLDYFNNSNLEVYAKDRLSNSPLQFKDGKIFIPTRDESLDNGTIKSDKPE